MQPEQLDNLRHHHATQVYKGTEPYREDAFQAWLSMQGNDTLMEIIKNNMKNERLTLSQQLQLRKIMRVIELVLSLAGYAILLIASWKVALGVFLINWGQGIV